MKHIGNLTYSEGAKQKKKRIGRGYGSGYGGTSTRGHKGQKSRSGATIRIGFEGGQMPMNRRVPKFGFFNRFRVEYQVVNLDRIQDLVDNGKISDTVDFGTLIDLGVINYKNKPLKVLGSGDLKSAVNITAHKFSKIAKEKIESAGGTVTLHE